MKWEEMTPRERDAAMAGLIQGWQEPWHGSGVTDAAQIPIPLFTTSHYGAHQAENEIERRGLQNEYEGELCRITGVAALYEKGESTLWKLIRAAPEQRCEAAWRAMGGE